MKTRNESQRPKLKDFYKRDNSSKFFISPERLEADIKRLKEEGKLKDDDEILKNVTNKALSKSI